MNFTLIHRKAADNKRSLKIIKKVSHYVYNYYFQFKGLYTLTLKGLFFLVF